VGANVTLENVTVTDIRAPTAKGDKKSYLTGYRNNGFGILAAGGEGVSKKNLTIKNCTIKDYQKHGVFVFDGVGELTFTNNVFRGMGDTKFTQDTKITNATLDSDWTGWNIGSPGKWPAWMKSWLGGSAWPTDWLFGGYGICLLNNNSKAEISGNTFNYHVNASYDGEILKHSSNDNVHDESAGILLWWDKTPSAADYTITGNKFYRSEIGIILKNTEGEVPAGLKNKFDKPENDFEEILKKDVAIEP
jgi:hypothetical protein